MARSDYGPEVKSSMDGPPSGGKPKLAPRRKQATPKPPTQPANVSEGQTGMQGGGLQNAPRQPVNTAPPPMAHGAPASNSGHAMMAASIAHAILNKGSGGGGY